MTRSLRKKFEFQKVYQEGVKRVGHFVVLYFLPAADDAVAVVASRKVGKAVQRNRAKRLLREALSAVIFRNPQSASDLRQRFYPTREEEEVKEKASRDEARGLWLVAVARQRINNASFADVRKEIKALLP